MRMVVNSKSPPPHKSGIRMRTRNRTKRNKTTGIISRGRAGAEKNGRKGLPRTRRDSTKRKFASGSTDSTRYFLPGGFFPEHHCALADGAPGAHVHSAQRRSLARLHRQL